MTHHTFKSKILLLFATLFIGCQNPPNAQVEEYESSIDEVIPFELTDANNISIKAVLNDKQNIDLMFHTAVTSVSLTTETIEKNSVDLDQSGSVRSWGGESSARFGGGHKIQIGNLVWEDLLVTESKLSGQKTGGKFGYNFFKDQIIKLDFEASTVHVHSVLPNIDDYEKFNIEFENEMMFVTGSLLVGSNQLVNRFLIHSGFGGAVLLDDEFVARHKLIERLEAIGESELKDSYGNVLKTKKLVLPAFSLGHAKLKNIPISVFEGAIRNQKMSVIGGDVLKRFHIVFDFRNSKLYLKPNSLFNSKFKS